MLMLVWGIYTGFRLVTEPRRDKIYNHLAFTIGVVSIAFGLVYFIIGLAILVDFSSQLLWKEKRNPGFVEGSTHDGDYRFV